jgi:anti-sigma regulatory factor (Ser/Thr protein kinase)
MRLDQTASMHGSPPALDGFDALLWSAEGRAADGPLADVEVAMDATAPGVARRIVSTCLAESVVPLTLEHARLIVSELVTNSLRHADLPDAATVRVSAAIAGGILRIEVEDGGSNGAVVRRTPNRDHGGGFGLNIIDALALRWGVKRGGGTVVWVELRC